MRVSGTRCAPRACSTAPHLSMLDLDAAMAASKAPVAPLRRASNTASAMPPCGGPLIEVLDLHPNSAVRSSHRVPSLNIGLAWLNEPPWLAPCS